MEDPGSVWQIGIIALLAGAMIGVLAYRLLSPSVKQADQIKSERDAARKELDSYKASVNQHFNKTSELVNDLTQNYVRVYQHLAEGVQTLGDGTNFDNLLEQRPGSVSIALDDGNKAEDEIAGDRIVETAVPPVETVEPVDEHAEPFTGASPRETGSVPAQDAGNESEVTEAADESETSAETEEPILNVDALAQAAESTDRDSMADAADAVTEEEQKTEARATTH